MKKLLDVTVNSITQKMDTEFKGLHKFYEKRLKEQ
jgi:hypothetical protein